MGVGSLRILSIDEATRSGWSLMIDGNVIETGAIILEHESRRHRFLEYYHRLNKLVLLKSPDLLVIEEPKHQRNAKILRYLTGLYTVAHMVSTKLNINAIEANPKEVKRFITGNGNASKHEVMEALIDKFNVRENLIYKPVYYKNESKGIKEFIYDESDATANGLYVYNNYSMAMSKLTDIIVGL